MNFEGNGVFVSHDFLQALGLALLLWGCWPLVTKIRTWWWSDL